MTKESDILFDGNAKNWKAFEDHLTKEAANPTIGWSKDILGNDVHLIYSRKVPLVIVNHDVINIMSPIGSLVIVYKYFVTWI
jgi:hypothetical protein